MMNSSLDNLLKLSSSKSKIRIAVAAAADEPVLSAIHQAYLIGLIKPLLVGDSAIIRSICKKNNFDYTSWEIIDEKDSVASAIIAVNIISKGNADVLMKGNVSTAPLLKAVLDKEYGIKKREILSHFALFQSSFYHKLFVVTDAAMNISPGLEEKRCIVENAVEVLHKLGNMMPKVAVIAPLEIINEKIPSTLDALSLKEMQEKNIITGCIIDGPMALDIAVSKESSVNKAFNSDVAGDADILLVPDLNSGNILYKSLVFLSDGLAASVIAGASSPIVLTSRADSDKSKLYSIALAATLI